METTKRVYCLYRVSTSKQLEKDDIPMQKQACREFAAQHVNMSAAFYTLSRTGFTLATLKFDTCVAEILH